MKKRVKNNYLVYKVIDAFVCTVHMFTISIG